MIEQLKAFGSNKSVQSIVGFLIILAAYMFFLHYESIEFMDLPKSYKAITQVADSEPLQQELAEQDWEPWSGGSGVLIRKKATFKVKARLIYKESFYLENNSQVMPYDFGVVWGYMSSASLLNQYRWRHTGRVLLWRTNNDEIDLNGFASNMHMIPDNEMIKNKLGKLKVGQWIEFEGFLVDVNNKGKFMNTSMSREDTGVGACEIVLVKQVNKLAD